MVLSLTLIMLISFCPENVVCLLHLLLKTYFIMEANTMNPDQTAFNGAVSPESACIFPFSFRGATPQLSFLRDLLKDQSLPCWSKSNGCSPHASLFIKQT